MDKFVIRGGKRLCGEVEISGAKNAAVAILPATLLCDDGICRIENVPAISDITAIIRILHDLGANVKPINKTTIEIDTRNVRSFILPASMTAKMRASSYFIGAMLGRFGKAKVAPPGGCDFGVRPIDQHIKGFELLGAKVDIENGMVNARASQLVGALVYLDKVSVGATVNIMLAAVKAQGLTIIENAAKEPHIVDLANFLNSMGADIMGAGTDTVKIRGVKSLHGATYSVIPDQIEAGTFMVAAAATGGDVLVKNVIPKHLESITAKLVEAGAKIEEFDEAIRVTANGRPKSCNVLTMPHPGFPTDMQPQMTTLLAIADGSSLMTEGVWDNRFKYVDQLTFMGAKIKVSGKVAAITGVEELKPAEVAATDLRAGAALVIAGLMAKGVTTVGNVEYIDRGYDSIVEKLSSIGADIKRVYYHTTEQKEAL